MMSGKDYYNTLGVSKSSSQDEIKKAYRRLALKYHPDQNQGDKAAEAKFKEISEAYAVLINPEKRKQYDMFGAETFQRRFTQEEIFRDFDFGDLFREFGFGFGGRGQSIFSQIFGGGGQAQYRRAGAPFDSFGGSGGHPQAMKGQDLIYELSLNLEDMLDTTEKVISYHVGGREQRVSVKVPAGISEGKKLRLAGKGHPGVNGGPPGDLYIHIKTLDHRIFKRDGDNLLLVKEIKFSEAMSGAEIEVPTIDKKTLRLKIPPGSQSNSKFRLKGYGMPRFKGNGRGDAYVQVTVAVPKRLNKKQKALLKELAEAGF
jgi:curved DNA-binding protein